MDFKEAEDFRDNYELCVEEAVNFLKMHITETPEFAIVLGTGMGDLAKSIDVTTIIPFSEIPFFPELTVKSHKGELIIGEIDGIPVIGLNGRKHYYEVADQPLNSGMLRVVLPVNVMAGIGVKNLFVTNAAGGLNLGYNKGDLMIISSHLNIQNVPNPLFGRKHEFKKVDGSETDRFVPLNGLYDENYRKLLRRSIAKEDNGKVREGVYAMVSGPTYESEAECIALRKLGADAVGMSTAPEAIIARNRGMKVVGLSLITNKIDENGANVTDHEEVAAEGDKPETKARIARLVTNFFDGYWEKAWNYC